MVGDDPRHRHPAATPGRHRERPCVTHNTSQQNPYHQGVFRNVQWHPQARKWMVRVVANGKVLYGGLHADVIDAVATADSLRAHAAQLRRDKRLLPSCYCCGHAEHLPDRCTVQWREQSCPCDP